MRSHLKITFFIFITCACLFWSEGSFLYAQERAGASHQKKGQEWVILIHGSLRGPHSMWMIEKKLEKQGYKVEAYGYSSRKDSIQDIAKELHAMILSLPKERGQVHFITHSMGAIVLRYYLFHYAVQRLGRVVMIAPPNQGSIIATHVRDCLIYKWAFGKSGQEVTQTQGSLPLVLPSPPCEFGVIAGGTRNHFGLNPFIPGDDDMTIGVEETKLKGMKDFILIKGQHSLLLLRPKVADNAGAFIQTDRLAIEHL